MKPRQRDHLVMRQLQDEAVAYDFTVQRAHCLNPTALAVWRRCDGKSTVKQIAEALTQNLGAPVHADVVRLALDQLAQAGLLSDPLPAPAVDLSRRRVLKKMAVAAGLSVALPVVWSILAPTPAYAASSCVASCAGATDGTCCGKSGLRAKSCRGGNCAGAGGCTGTCP